MSQLVFASCAPACGLVHTTAEKFETGEFTLKTHQMPEKFKNAKITGCFGFMLEENSGRQII